MEDWFSIADIDVLDTPALVVYPEKVKYNIKLLAKSINSLDRLRPHIKTHKCKEAVFLAIQAGINKFKCATIAEAELLGLCGVSDALLAYQPIGPKLQRFINLIKNYKLTHFSCLIDNYESAREISELAVLNWIRVKVYIDLNVGMNRSGIYPHDAFELYLRCAPLPGIEVVGLHVYDGHIHNPDFDLRKQQCDNAFALVEELAAQMQQAGFEPIIVAGGSPTFPVHAMRKDVECSPGTFIYWDAGYKLVCAEQGFLPAALVITRVVSLPDETKICVDLGHKSIASENGIEKRVRFLNAPELKFISHSEEHMVLNAGIGHNYQVGDVLYGLPHHICPTVALYEKAVTITHGKVSGEWKTIARNRTINY
ncbi:MAG: D-TA family PLP-dependent enzyme [Mucilaginibacter sp.]